MFIYINTFHKLHQFLMYRNVVTEMSCDRNGQTESARPKRLRPKWLRPKRPDRIGQTEWSCTRFLHPYESNFPFIPVLSTRIIRAPLLPGRHCRVSIPETQTCLHVLFLLSAYNTIHTTPGTTSLVTAGTRSPARTKSVVRGPVLKITLA